MNLLKCLFTRSKEVKREPHFYHTEEYKQFQQAVKWANEQGIYVSSLAVKSTWDNIRFAVQDDCVQKVLDYNQYDFDTAPSEVYHPTMCQYNWWEEMIVIKSLFEKEPVHIEILPKCSTIREVTNYLYQYVPFLQKQIRDSAKARRNKKAIYLYLNGMED